MADAITPDNAVEILRALQAGNLNTLTPAQREEAEKVWAAVARQLEGTRSTNQPKEHNRRRAGGEMTPATLSSASSGPAAMMPSCPICMESMAQPITTTFCQHTFCRGCISRILTSNAARCPLCRSDLSNDITLMGTIQTHLTRCVIGNIYKELDPGTLPEGASSRCYHWYEAYVQFPGGNRHIQRVFFHLHPTYRTRTIRGQRSDTIPNAISVVRRAWGYFTIHVEIHETNGAVHRLSLPLNFNNDKTERAVWLNKDTPAADWRPEEINLV